MPNTNKKASVPAKKTSVPAKKRDAGLIFAGQKVEHYEIATYGGLAEIARTPGLMEIAAIFETTLAEEKNADELLTKPGRKNINTEASYEYETPGFFERVMSLVS